MQVAAAGATEPDLGRVVVAEAEDNPAALVMAAEQAVMVIAIIRMATEGGAGSRTQSRSVPATLMRRSRGADDVVAARSEERRTLQDI